MARYKKSAINRDFMPGLFDNLLSDPGAKPLEVPPPPGLRRARNVKSGGMRRNDNEDERPGTTPLDPLESNVEIDALRFISFGSGSSGNCAYLGDSRFGVLIDAGVEPRYIEAELLRNGIDMSSIGGIILTHDHSDHVRYAYSIMRSHRHIRLYCTPRTINGMLRRHNISRRIKDYHQPIFKEFPFHLGNFTITPFETIHDGSDNVGFFIKGGKHNFVVATDMGRISERADYYMRQANYLMIEANYDLTMLMNGTYAEYLKARIIAERGHMDNVATATYLANIHTPALRYVFLCHLSNDNNTPDKALATVGDALKRRGLKVAGINGGPADNDADVRLGALPRFESTGSIILRLS